MEYSSILPSPTSVRNEARSSAMREGLPHFFFKVAKQPSVARWLGFCLLRQNRLIRPESRSGGGCRMSGGKFGEEWGRVRTYTLHEMLPRAIVIYA